MARKKELIHEVSIVVPIYNGAEFVSAKLESLKGIEGVNCEVIIALNKSTDESENLIDCHGRDIPNLRVIKYSSYVEGGKNFEDGVMAARGDFIFVSAVDDICDKEFYREAVEILIKNDNVCAVSPMSRFEDNSHGDIPIGFELLGDTQERIRTLFQNIRVSHGIFYSLMRRNIATTLYRDFSKEHSFIGSDWLFDLKLALEGQVFRAKRSACVFGVNGMSKGRNHLYPVGTSYFKRIFPYSDLIAKIFILSKKQKLSVKVLLFKISLVLLRRNLHRYIFSFPIIRKLWKLVTLK